MFMNLVAIYFDVNQEVHPPCNKNTAEQLCGQKYISFFYIYCSQLTLSEEQTWSVV